MIYILSSLLVIALLIITFTIGFDLFLYFKSVFFRIHIGRWKSRTEWFAAINKINYEWLKNTPTVKLTDNERYVIKDIWKGKYKNNTIQSWQEGGMLLGAISLPAKKDDPRIINFLSKKIDNTGHWKQMPQYVDTATLAYAIAKQETDIDKIKPALDATIDLINGLKGTDGTIAYRDFIPEIRFVDTIGFICPFLTFYGVKFNRPEYIDLAFHQIEQYSKKALLSSNNIPAHAFDNESQMPLGIYGWGRGLGWYILGIVDMYNELPTNHVKKESMAMLIEKTAENTLKFQKENGSFGAMIAVKNYRHDSSITTLAGWLFLNAYKINSNKLYYNAANKCIDSLMGVTRRDGVIDFCQGDTKGIGDYAKTFDLMPFVQGLTIRLYNTLNEIEN